MSQFPPPPAGNYPPPPPQGYAPPPPPPPPPGYPGGPQPKTNGLAVGSFISGLLGCIPVIGPLLAIVLGILGVKEAKKHNVGGRGLAITGIVLGLLWIGIYAVGGGAAYVMHNASKPARDLATAFARDVAAGSVDAAMARTTSNVSRDHLSAAAAALQPLGTVTDTTMFGTPGDDMSGNKAWVVAGAITFGNQAVQYVAKVVDHSGTPRVDGFVFTVNGKPVGGGADKPDENATPNQQ